MRLWLRAVRFVCEWSWELRDGTEGSCVLRATATNCYFWDSGGMPDGESILQGESSPSTPESPAITKLILPGCIDSSFNPDIIRAHTFYTGKMIGNAETLATAFSGTRRIASGQLKDIISAVKAVNENGETFPILVFDDVSSHQIEVDLRGSVDDAIARLAPAASASAPEAETESPRGPGRPKLGVVPREITLLPRHWDWLAQQPGGASVAIRKLVDEAKRQNEGRDRARVAQESAYRFMSTMAGNQTNFEEATRAFFANDVGRFEAMTEEWPADVREHSRVLASRAFGATEYRVV
jgi:hypothetical protein